MMPARCRATRQTQLEATSVNILPILQAEQATAEARREHQNLEAELSRLAGLVISFQRELSQVRIGMQYSGAPPCTDAHACTSYACAHSMQQV